MSAGRKRRRKREKEAALVIITCGGGENPKISPFSPLSLAKEKPIQKQEFPNIFSPANYVN